MDNPPSAENESAASDNTSREDSSRPTPSSGQNRIDAISSERGNTNRSKEPQPTAQLKSESGPTENTSAPIRIARQDRIKRTRIPGPNPVATSQSYGQSGNRSRVDRDAPRNQSNTVSRSQSTGESSEPYDSQSIKRTNQQDRYLRPSLSQHGARPHTTERSSSPRRYSSGSGDSRSNFQTPPRVQIGRNPRLNEDRQLVSKAATNEDSPPRSNANGSGSGHINRRRFSGPNTPKNNNASQSNQTNQVRNDAAQPQTQLPVVLGSGSKKLRIIPMGGAGEVGSKNMTAFEFGQDILIIDCGIAFPDKDMLGVDSIIPDTTYLEQRKANIRGMVFTHGHDDHTGSVPYVWPKLGCPMYATPLTCGLIQHKLDEAGIKNAPLSVIQAGDKLHFGQMSVEMVRLTHSIPDVLGLAIRCPAGLFFYATDWRLEYTPALGKSADWIRVAELGGEGITALFSDSTNVDRSGYSPSEKMIGDAFDRIFQEAKGRVIIAQFSSQINRIQQVMNAAKKVGRHIAISGRSMETYVNIAMKLGYLKVPENMLVDLRKINTVDPRKLTVLSTGSQGEEFSSLVRISEGEHRHVKLDKTDTVVISASTVPGNETAVDKLIDNLYREGANVIHTRLMTDIHVSGHPSRDELKLMFALTQPRYFIPIHGDYHRMVEHGKVAEEMGVAEENVLLMENGNVVEFDSRGGRITSERIQLNDIMIDGKGIGDVQPVVIRDRQILGNEGMVIVLLSVNGKTGDLTSPPDIISRGFIYMRDAEDLINRTREEIKKSYERAHGHSGTNWDEIKQAVKDDTGKYLENQTGRNPMVIPVINTV